VSDNKQASLEFVIDTTNGACLNQVTRGGQQNVQSEVLQGGFNADQTSVLFPKFNLHCSYEHGNLRKLVLFYLLSAEFNQSIDGSAFKVPAEAGDLIVDRRHVNNSRPQRVSTSIDDVTKSNALPDDRPPNRDNAAPNRKTAESPSMRSS
jgi:hypothetical protein